ncbi:GNAT family N-acetyltransferase [Paenisporosarcina cavernae]|uniref:GNAT family N-acetyltransferase n=1 Tax=Paenisporosarcina cavernae TaxID=2320858 RepID=A0A385YY48_9BACL|nr:GNAT family N-acetyltransferase [Paenisporosarcina cavernae]AYC30548.1 GNAT family N-acetyltransferase [Paenisporosarcina cavernae]
MNISIRSCTMNDLYALQTLGILTYDETFRAHNTDVIMKEYLDAAFHLNKLKRELENDNSGFYFASVDDKLAGYLKVNVGAGQTEDMGEDTLEIERIYVLQEFQKHGVGKLLYQKALDIANENEKKKIWLGVWENNFNALAFYNKLGFVRHSSHSFFMGDDEQLDYIMLKEI